MDTYTIGQFARKIKKTVSTLQKWDRSGRLKSRRTSTNRRYYTEDDFLQVMGLEIPQEERVSLSYCRVSSSSQKNDLKTQSSAVQDFCLKAGIACLEHMSDIGSGLNYKRKNFLRLMEMVEQNKINTLVIAHKDRLVRFGFEWFEDLCKRHKTKILIINNDSLSPQEEMTKDLLSIIHCFSSRLYGLRKYKGHLKKMISEEE